MTGLLAVGFLAFTAAYLVAMGGLALYDWWTERRYYR